MREACVAHPAATAKKARLRQGISRNTPQQMGYVPFKFGRVRAPRNGLNLLKTANPPKYRVFGGRQPYFSRLLRPPFYVPSSRAQHRSSRRQRPSGCLSASEFPSVRRPREAQGNPKGPATRAVSFGSFSWPHKKLNRDESELLTPGLSPGCPSKFLSDKHRKAG
jgi:hypothetical protein